MQLIVDGRKAFDSGIGTYIRCVVPRVVELLHDVRVGLILPRGQALQHDYINLRRVAPIELGARPFSLAEQLELRRHLSQGTMFWATSLAHPLFTPRPLIATVHDVAQLALGREGGISVALRVAAYVHLKSLLQRAQLLLVNSLFTRDEFVNRVGSRPDLPIAVTPLAVGPDWFSARATPASTGSKPYFVCVGNIRPHKNLKTLLLAFAQIAHRLPHELVLVGQQNATRTADDNLSRHLERLGMRVHFTGFLPDAELRGLVARADALVFPSLYEGFGLPALEAMAAGCPVIASSAGALPEVCGDAAEYFDPHSPEQLGQRLLQHAGLTPARRAAMVERAVVHARNYTWEHTADLTAHAIEAAMAGYAKR